MSRQPSDSKLAHDKTELASLLAKEKEDHLKTKIKLQARERDLHTIRRSTTYRIARAMAGVKAGVRTVVKKGYDLVSVNGWRIRANKRYVKRAYSSELFYKELTSSPKSKTAVIIHLYYPDLLGYFQRNLQRLDIDYDLFITVTDKESGRVDEIKKALPGARVAVVPNCGRDVLPFMEVMRKIEPLGYSRVLKLHSKKSPHRNDGGEWRDEIVQSLIPVKKSLRSEIIRTLDKKDSAVVGPHGQYVSFLVNFSATYHHTDKVIQELFDKKTADMLTGRADEYGFFGGTMFWARVDAIAPILSVINAVDFEPEMGQEDSTLAHALERLFCVVSELQKKSIYEIEEDTVQKLDYHTTNIPSWSEVAVD